MIVVFCPVNDFSGPMISYFSIILGSSQLSEFEKFMNKDFSEHQLELQILKKQLKSMGVRGAKPRYFPKGENGAYALPVVNPEIKNNNKVDFGIRLYLDYPHENYIFLLNGGVKTKQNPRHCPNVRDHFDKAVKFNRRMSIAINDKNISFNGQMTVDNGFDFIL